MTTPAGGFDDWWLNKPSVSEIDVLRTRIDLLQARISELEAAAFIAARDAATWDAATIEHCAQVAEQCNAEQRQDIYGIGNEIAAAIRASREKP